MKTIIRGSDVEVCGENAQAALDSHVFKSWINRVSSKFSIRRIEFQSVDFAKNHDNRVFFIKLKADVVDNSGRPVSGIVFLRGGSVAILVVLRCEGVEYTVLVNQARFAMGNIPYSEIPAGMLDENGDFAGVAAKELGEELNLHIDSSQLGNLMEGNSSGDPGIYPSPGACDEFISLYLFEKDVSVEELESFKGKATGALTENEHIVLSIIPLEDIPRVLSDGKSIIAYCLYKRLLAERSKV